MTTAMQTPQTQAPSFEPIFEAIHGFQRTAAIKAAIELDLFTAVADGSDTPSALARSLSASERGLRILCDYLVVIGLLQKTDGRYQPTVDTRTFLNKKGPTYVGSTLEFLLSPPQVEAFGDLTTAVRNGGRTGDQGAIAPENPIWVTFARAMAPLMAFPAHLLTELLATDSNAQLKVLDIAAGHGLYGIAFANRNPNANIVALDWSPVLQVAVENAKAFGVADRYGTIAGDALEVDLGTSYDLVLLVHLLHHFDPGAIGKLLRKVYAALKDGGRLAILEFIPNADRVSPPAPAMFSLMMLATTPSGDAYTYAEFERFLREAGFSSSDLFELAPTFFRVVVASK
jgi:ubiquinone/menaquinone biosynthesis C-methylase UbiE